ncbi:outer membrane beta-barrel protein [Portibacter lacus]|uniref:Collagen-binding protein n=1 Tax=Portibacter lacus TaxID=1099794 RepID=A0AA37WI92_9BACT|nr:outer membrane beta-barrel protein [Portibacter lacus]GLR19410.1 collagen-binding protein [Portibacter lacus]
MKYFFIFLSLLFVQVSIAQKISISGKILEGENNEPVIGASISLLQSIDSLLIRGEVSDIEGNFLIKNIKSNDFLLRINYLGFEPIYHPFNAEKDIDLGTFKMYESAELLDEIVVEAEVVTGTQRGDTISYNAAAFTTLADADTKDLIAKMPGIVIIDGQVQAEGEAVQKVLVDGKEFFGGNVNTALESLPAEIVQNIEIYDKKSDKAELTGFDDGNELKTINIVTKPSKKVGQFGKLSAGIGTNENYRLNSKVNFFNDEQRWTVNADANKIHLSNLTVDSEAQSGNYNQDGENNSNNIGIQYSNTFFKKLEFSGNYRYGNSDNRSVGNVYREYSIPSRSDQIYKEFSSTGSSNLEHNFNVRLEYQVNDRNKFIFTPRVTLKNNSFDKKFQGATSILEDPLNYTTNVSDGITFDNDYKADLHYSHKFSKKGRTISLRAVSEYHTNDDDGNRIAENIFYTDSTQVSEDLNQNIIKERSGFDVEFGASFTEPLGKNSRIEIEYEIRNRKNDSDQLNYDLQGENPNGDPFRYLDTMLSNVFNTEYVTNEAKFGYLYRLKNIKFQTHLEFQRADLMNAQYFPYQSDLNRNFFSILPNFRFDYKIGKNSNIEVNYYTSTREPGIGQLQEVINNSNPLRLYVGNTNLDQEYNNRIRARYKVRNSKKERNLYIGLDASIVNNDIINSTFIAEEEVRLSDEITLPKGGQLNKPVNVDGSWNVRTSINYGQPIKLIKSNVNFRTSIRHSQLPGIINDEIALTNSTNFNFGISLSSNISDRIDFNISSSPNYNLVDNSLKPNENRNYFSHTGQVDFKAIMWQGITFKTNIKHQYIDGLSGGTTNTFILIGGSIGKKIFKNERGEISISVYDLLNQNNNINRRVTESYIQISESTVLQRYFMLNFTYNLRRFAAGLSQKDFKLDDQENRRRRRY